MKSKLLGAAFAAALPFAFSVGSANAVTFDVTGQNIFGDTVTGVIDGDALLTLVTAANLQISNQSNPFNIFVSYSAPILTVENNQPFQASITLNFDPNFTTTTLLAWTTQHAANSATAISNFNFAVSLCAGDTDCQNQAEADLSIVESQTFATFNSEFAATVVAEADTTPLPAALPLFATGLGALGLLARRRKRKQAA